MKICSKCKEDKSLTLFNKNKSRRDGLQTICKRCSSARSRKYYTDNTVKHKKVTYARTDKQRQRNREFVYAYLLNNPCVSCTETDPVVLEFDHLRDKRSSICKMVAAGCSVETIEEEIEKCQVLCANCHRRKTAKQFNWIMYNQPS